MWQVSMQVASSLNDVVVDTQRRKHLAYLMADHGTIVNPEASRNLPKQVLYTQGLKQLFFSDKKSNLV